MCPVSHRMRDCCQPSAESTRQLRLRSQCLTRNLVKFVKLFVLRNRIDVPCSGKIWRVLTRRWQSMKRRNISGRTAVETNHCHDYRTDIVNSSPVSENITVNYCSVVDVLSLSVHYVIRNELHTSRCLLVMFYDFVSSAAHCQHDANQLARVRNWIIVAFQRRTTVFLLFFLFFSSAHDCKYRYKRLITLLILIWFNRIERIVRLPDAVHERQFCEMEIFANFNVGKIRHLYKF